ncbi:hypothetical protein I546_3961 [Mycobacterium kansasii 732]|nr:hypothetical protein I546_3961 [Mycobacterium kansasii 732]
MSWQAGRPGRRQRGAAVIGDRGIGPVGRKLQAIGHAGQRIFPKPHLGGQRTCLVGQIAETFPLPQRVIGLLHRQFGATRARPTHRLIYATPTSAASTPIDQPSPAMWCTTITSACSCSATLKSFAREGCPVPRSKG